MEMPISFLDSLLNDPLLLRGLILFSIAFFIFGILSIPYLVCRIPEDYFLRGRRSWRHSYARFGVGFVFVLAVKNLLAVLLLVAGLLMLFLPGQGLLTLFLGVVLLDFPGKYRMERWLIKKPTLNKSLNWIRTRRKVPAIQIPSIGGHNT